MEYTPLADPFTIKFEKEGITYLADIVYAKSATSCAHFYNVIIGSPEGIEPFCLKEKPVHHQDNDSMVWVDEEGRESEFYQLIGQEIANQMKDQLGVLLIDTPVAEKAETDDK